jgi:hypothetical protein
MPPASICVGVQLQRNILSNRALRESDSEAVIDQLAASLDAMAGPAPAKARRQARA